MRSEDVPVLGEVSRFFHGSVLRFPHEHLCQGPPSSNSQDGGQGEDGEALASGDIGKTQNRSKQYCNVRFKDITSNVHSRHE